MPRLSTVLLLVSVLAPLAVAGCSTLKTGSLQDVTLTTPGAADTRCFIRNSRFLYVINPPRRFQIEKSDLPYTVTCLAPGNRRKTITLPSTYNTRSNQNLYNGYLPGTAVDLVSGAAFSYPDQVIVDFTGVPPQRMPLPDYQVMLDENPLMRGMEEFRPGTSALQSDQNQVVEPMQKRPPGDMDDTFGTMLEPGEGNAAGSSPAGAAQSAPQAPASHAAVVTAPTQAAAPATSVPATTSGAGPSSGMMRGLPSWGGMSGAPSSASSSPGSGSGGFAGGTATPQTSTTSH